jgi:hypothetical protein
MPQHPHDDPELNLLCRTDIYGLFTSVIQLCYILASKRMTRDVIVSWCSALYRCRHSHHGNQTIRGGGGELAVDSAIFQMVRRTHMWEWYINTATAFTRSPSAAASVAWQMKDLTKCKSLCIQYVILLPCTIYSVMLSLSIMSAGFI